MRTKLKHFIALLFALMNAVTTLAFGGNPKEAQQKLLVLKASDTSWALRRPAEDKVVYQGVLANDAAAGVPGGMLYPAVGLAGLAAAIVTHGILVNAQHNHEKSKQQEAADQVLIPYQPILDTLTYKDLIDHGLAKAGFGGAHQIIEATGKADRGWIIDTTPVYEMTQDQRALILNNGISIYAADAPETPVYQNTIKVLAAPLPDTDPQARWKADQGAFLKEESEALYAQSLQILFEHLVDSGGTDDSHPYRTVRYAEGSNQKIERAQVLDQQCARVLLRNLRGWYISAPRSAENACNGNSDTASVPKN